MQVRGEAKRKIRLKNLRLLHQKYSWIDIANRCNVTAAYLSQIANEVRRDGGSGNPRALTDLYADRIEKGLGLPAGWFDQDHGVSNEPPLEQSEPEPKSNVAFLASAKQPSTPPAQQPILLGGLEYHLISHGRASGNPAAPWTLHRPAAPVALPVEWFAQKGVNPADCRAVIVDSDAMEPAVSAGGVVVVDTSRTESRDNSICALLMDGALIIRRVFRAPGAQLILSADNPHFQSFTVPSDSITNLGEVVWRAG